MNKHFVPKGTKAWFRFGVAINMQSLTGLKYSLLM
jgi:hypothetical protein